jgi:hypothetical protein
MGRNMRMHRAGMTKEALSKIEKWFEVKDGAGS